MHLAAGVGRAGLADFRLSGGEHALLDGGERIPDVRREDVVIGPADHIRRGDGAVGIVSPGVAQLPVLGECVDMSAMQRRFQPRLRERQLARPLIEPPLEFAAGRIGGRFQSLRRHLGACGLPLPHVRCRQAREAGHGAGRGDLALRGPAPYQPNDDPAQKSGGNLGRQHPCKGKRLRTERIGAVDCPEEEQSRRTSTPALDPRLASRDAARRSRGGRPGWPAVRRRLRDRPHGRERHKERQAGDTPLPRTQQGQASRSQRSSLQFPCCSRVRLGLRFITSR